MDERIELLSVSLLDSERNRITELKNLAQRLKLEFGWHYMLDISWILSQIDQITDRRFMDAGAGTGLIQWYLAENSATVISVDRESRENLAPKFRRRYSVEGLRSADLSSENESSKVTTKSLKSMAADWVDQIRFGMDQLFSNNEDSPGRVIIYNQDLTDLEDIGADSIDVIVAFRYL